MNRTRLQQLQSLGNVGYEGIRLNRDRSIYRPLSREDHQGNGQHRKESQVKTDTGLGILPKVSCQIPNAKN